jgi:hypothetical protein
MKKPNRGKKEKQETNKESKKYKPTLMESLEEEKSSDISTKVD